MEFISDASFGLINLYNDFLSVLPSWIQNSINLFLISIIIVIYAIAIWKFYRFTAKKNILELNLNQYNRSSKPTLKRTIKILLYTCEYIIILPFLVLFWFTMFTIFLLFLTTNLELNTILIISATIIVAVRMTAYYKEDISKEIAKLLPYTLLGVAITQGGIMNITRFIERILELPIFFNHITSYLLFIFVIEFLLRIIETLFVASGIEDPEEIKEDE